MLHASASSLFESDDVATESPRVAHDPVESSSRADRQRAKAQDVGQLAAGVAHDLGNFLQVVANSLELLDRRNGSDAAAHRLTGVARKALTRATKLSWQLLTLSRGHELQLEVLRLDDLQSTMGDILKRAMPESIELEIRHAPDLWSCTSDSCLLEAALLNLAINGRDAMPSGGTLTIDVVNRVVEGTQGSAPGLRDGEYVVASVTDTGSGMQPDVLARAFEPFFTTKTCGRGTGLGLSQVQAFAKRCNGYATIESNPGLGTRVSIHLPRTR